MRKDGPSRTGLVIMAYASKPVSSDETSTSAPTPSQTRHAVGTEADSEVDALSVRQAGSLSWSLPGPRASRAPQRSLYAEESLPGPAAAQEAIDPRVTRQAREMASRIDVLAAQHVVSPELRRLAHELATDLGAEHLTKPAENPERPPGTLTDQIRPVQETARDLVGQLRTATEHSQPLRKQLADVVKTAGQLDRGLTRLLNSDLSPPGLETPSPGGPAETGRGSATAWPDPACRPRRVPCGSEQPGVPGGRGGGPRARSRQPAR
jgi:hypothetical protein